MAREEKTVAYLICRVTRRWHPVVVVRDLGVLVSTLWCTRGYIEDAAAHIAHGVAIGAYRVCRSKLGVSVTDERALTRALHTEYRALMAEAA